MVDADERIASLTGGMKNPIVVGQAALQVLQSVARISVIGRSGGGKSTFSKAVSAARNLPYVPMDRELFWLPGWQRRPAAEIRRLLAGFVSQEKWIIDGTNPSNFDLRLPRTELIVWLHLPALTCLMGVYRRSLTSYGRVREELAEGCPEKLPDREFRSYIWNFEEKHMPKVKSAISSHGSYVPLLPIVERQQTNWYLERLQSIQ
ncbi:MAG: AAA family ATPase [Pseudomonadota bacterium]